MLMFHDDLTSKVEAERPHEPDKKTGAGKSLKRIFRQDEPFKKIESQPATVSLFMNRKRLSIFLHLCQNPCDHTRSIARSLGIGLADANWHLGQLFQKGYVESVKLKGKRVYWPTGMILPNDIEIVKTLRNDWAQQIVNMISESGGDTRQKIVVAGMEEIQQNVNAWLGILTSVGLLDKTGHRMNARYRIAAKIPLKVAEYDYAAKRFSAIILNLLRNDGLMPKKARLRGSRLYVNVKLPSENIKLSIECNPLAPLNRIMKLKKS
jgi:hypothetical protein